MVRFTAFMAVILSPVSVAFALNSLLGNPRLILADEGFTIRSLLSKRTYAWIDNYDFEILEVKGFRKISFRRRGSDEVGDIQLYLYNESAEEILHAMEEWSRSRANGA